MTSVVGLPLRLERVPLTVASVVCFCAGFRNSQSLFSNVHEPDVADVVAPSKVDALLVY